MNILKCIKVFEIGVQPWSDHLPITVSLRDLKGEKDSCHNRLPKLIWKDEWTKRYQENLNKNLTACRESDGLKCLEDLVKLIEHSAPKPPIKNSGLKFKEKWFNGNCAKARKQCFAALNNLRRKNDETSREIYLKTKKEYKGVCIRSKEKYEKEIINKLNEVRDANSWWSFAKELRGTQTKTHNEIEVDAFKFYFERLLNPPQGMKILSTHQHFIKMTD